MGHWSWEMVLWLMTQVGGGTRRAREGQRRLGRSGARESYGKFGWRAGGDHHGGLKCQAEELKELPRTRRQGVTWGWGCLGWGSCCSSRSQGLTAGACASCSQ